MLTQSQVDAYKRDGYYFPVDILTPAETAPYRQKLETYEASGDGPIKGNLRQKPHLLFTWLNELIRHPKILDTVESIHGPDLLCWSSSFFIKEPRNAGYVSWHQDSTYWGLSSPDVVTVWLALTPANDINGAMKFLPGTQHEQLGHQDTFHQDNLLSRGQELAVEVNEEESVLVTLEPGQASLHHVMLFHGSAPNRSADRRIGLAIRYIPTYVRQIAGVRDAATLVRGVDRYKHFDAEPAPDFDLAPDAVARHAAIVGQQAQILYRGTGKAEFRP
ncbi:MAG: phytanoyl-CoA dioxygenase [Acetobacteraceae bacterium]|nr:phytanoyl-CoA dioxygenase [Acetobacteraceae bacterium]